MHSHVALIGNLFFDRVWSLDRWPERSQTNVARSVVDTVGGIANVARTLRMLAPELEISLHSAVGDDTAGFAVREILLRENLSTRQIATVRNEQTTSAAILVDFERVERTSLVAEGACTRAKLDFDIDASWCHIAYLDTLHAIEREDLMRLREREIPISADLCRAELDPVARERVFEMLTLVDYLIVSDTECRALRGASASDAVRALGRWVQGWAIVHTPAGSVCSDGTTIRSAPAEKDPTITNVLGAGDAFAAGFIWKTLEGRAIDVAVTAGHDVATDSLRIRA